MRIWNVQSPYDVADACTKLKRFISKKHRKARVDLKRFIRNGAWWEACSKESDTLSHAWSSLTLTVTPQSFRKTLGISIEDLCRFFSLLKPTIKGGVFSHLPLYCIQIPKRAKIPWNPYCSSSSSQLQQWQIHHPFMLPHTSFPFALNSVWWSI